LQKINTVKQPNLILLKLLSRIGPATFRFVAQFLNQLRHSVPPLGKVVTKIELYTPTAAETSDFVMYFDYRKIEKESSPNAHLSNAFWRCMVGVQMSSTH
jgi:hypothetical protein